MCMDMSELLCYVYGHVCFIILYVWMCLSYYAICMDVSELLFYVYGHV